MKRKRARTATSPSPKRLFLLGSIALVAVAAAAFALQPQAEETVPIGELSQRTHVHGIAVDPKDPSRIYLATHHGLFGVSADGTATRLSEVQDFMGFTPHPTDPEVLYASGHPASGGNLGFIASTDQGRTWTQISPGVNGPVDFHQMDASPAAPDLIYGAYGGGLQVSRDAGRSWEQAGPAPRKLIDLAASAANADRLYAATETGLLVSSDAGKFWEALLTGAPVSMVEVTPDGVLYAFVVGRGLVRAEEPPLNLRTVGDGFGQDYILHLAADPADPNRLFAVTGNGRILASTDQGKNWAAFGGSGS